MDAAVTEYGALGAIRAPSANTVVFSPSGSFMGRDGDWVYVTASGNAVFYRLAAAIGKPELINDPRFVENTGRVEHRIELSGIISEWSSQHDAAEVERILNEASVPASKIFSMADCVSDPHYAARGAVLKVNDPHAGPLLHPPIAAKFDVDGSQPGVAWTGGALGEHNHEVLGGLLGMPDNTLEALTRDAVI